MHARRLTAPAALFLVACAGASCAGSGSEGAGGAPPSEGAAPAPAPVVPPEVPDVAPLDGDGDRLDDAFATEIEGLRLIEAAAPLLADRARAARDLDAPVRVEAVFSRGIGAAELRAFEREGGQIEHVFKAVAHGFTGVLPSRAAHRVAARLGPHLLLLRADLRAKLHLDEATRTGRVRPVWAPGFANRPLGFSGRSSTTIAVLDTGVDDSHPDLAGRLAYWNDYTSDALASPADVEGHGTHVAGIALGTGAAFGLGPGVLRFTDSGDLGHCPSSPCPSGSYYPRGFHLPATQLTLTASATWNGGGTTLLALVTAAEGSSSWAPAYSVSGASPLPFVQTFTPSASQHFSLALTQSGAASITTFAVATSIPGYPAVGDGFNALRGVAPGCKWAGAKVFTTGGGGSIADIGEALDDIVVQRASRNIKLANLSLGIQPDGTQDPVTRAKVNTAVRSGIVVVVSAGNAGATGGMSDPARAELVITAGASSDQNQLTSYSTPGFASPSTTEDTKPDVIAPGGSSERSLILAPDSNDADAASTSFPDRVADDYANFEGTSMSAPFVTGAAALVVDALEAAGTTWDFGSAQHPLLVKMLLCASATETNQPREGGGASPTLGRAAAPKDTQEGYGIINPDAAAEAVSLSYAGDGLTDTSAGGRYDRRAWGRKVALVAGTPLGLSLTMAGTADYDLYLYAAAPDAKGNPVILAASTTAGLGAPESLSYTPTASGTGYLFVKRVSGSGTFWLAGGPSWRWAATGATAAARSGPGLVLLDTGKALAAGGNTTPLAAAELYDPTSSTWAVTSPMSVARAGHTLTKLPSGRVLAVGGGAASAEVYDPATGAWAAAGTLSAPLVQHTATRLFDGRILVAGGGAGAGGPALATAALHDPATGVWSTVAPMATARMRHAATLLPTGAVLVSGGDDGSTPVALAELFDPATGTWSPAGTMSAPRTRHTATLLWNGRVLVAGGESAGAPTAAVETFDPTTAGWALTGAMSSARAAHSATLLPSGRLLVAGGDVGPTSAQTAAEVYDPAAGTWSTTAALLAPRRGHGAVVLGDGRVLATGGAGCASGCGALATAELYGVGAANGAPCASAGLCVSGQCVDGVCCDLPCGGGAADCQACSAALGATKSGACSVLSASAVCRAAAGPCDAAEHCTGASIVCPPDGLQPAGTPCRAAAGACDVAEACSGTSTACPADALAPAGTPCRASASACDQAETCTGSSPSCPNDVMLPDGAACNDGSACTQVDVCQAGVCMGGSPVKCTAADACHLAGTCDPTTGQCSSPAKPNGTPCNDGDACTQSDTCQGGVCVGANPVVCPAADQCHVVAACDHATGQCAVSAKPDGAPCDDGDACTQTDTCQAGVCVGASPVLCIAKDGCHAPGVCSPATGQCSQPAMPNGSACSDGDACTQSDTCQGGVCVGASPVLCPVADGCHLPVACDPQTGQCPALPAKPDGTACDDGNACTQTDACQAGVCKGSDPVVCPPADACHEASVCYPSSGTCSVPIPKPDGSTCDDGDACTKTDTCQGGACKGGSPVTCKALDGCHIAGTCDPATGKCGNPSKPDGTSCADGDPCTQPDRCQGGVCVGEPVTCAPSDPCHLAGTCDPVEGQCTDPPAPDGTACPGGACASGVCVPDPDAGGGGAGGATTTTTVSGGGATTTGTPGPEAPASGCGCRAAGEEAPAELPGGALVAAAALSLAGARRRRGRGPGGALTR